MENMNKAFFTAFLCLCIGLCAMVAALDAGRGRYEDTGVLSHASPEDRPGHTGKPVRIKDENIVDTDSGDLWMDPETGLFYRINEKEHRMERADFPVQGPEQSE